jgi:hypothetical protein
VFCRIPAGNPAQSAAIKKYAAQSVSLPAPKGAGFGGLTFVSRFQQPFGQSMKETAFSDVIGLLNLAESVYASIQKNGVPPRGAEPDTFKFPLSFAGSSAKVFAVVSNGRVKEIEIRHETGETETIPSPKY